tara:strand:+ start:467 stop:607 length:141 start_codon:yes stop_codon:yes gene_type:complete
LFKQVHQLTQISISIVIKLLSMSCEHRSQQKSTRTRGRIEVQFVVA